MRDSITINQQQRKRSLINATQTYDISHLPLWIRESEFVKQYEIDYPDEPIQVDDDRIFEFPSELNESNLPKLLDNLRYFGIDDFTTMYNIFLYVIQNEEILSNLEILFGRLHFKSKVLTHYVLNFR